MTKTEARAYLRRARQGVRDAEAALRAGDVDALLAAVQEVGGCAGTIESALDLIYGEGVSGMTEPTPAELDGQDEPDEKSQRGMPR